jgi:hypothetical protein
VIRRVKFLLMHAVEMGRGRRGQAE